MIPIFCGETARQKVASVVQAADTLTDTSQVATTVREIITQVRERGDTALAELAAKFGESPPAGFRIAAQAMAKAGERLSPETRKTIELAANNIRNFNQVIMQSLRPVRMASTDCEVGLDWRPVERVACYVPGGRYPLPSTALMTAITAKVAGVEQVCILSPRFPDEVLYAAQLAGVTECYQVGGAQAVAAVAFGTASIPKTDMLVGPGNAYVTEAKRQLAGRIGIDMLAGPSEVTIIADGRANPAYIAADLLAQAEHDPMASVILLTTEHDLATQVQIVVVEQFKALALGQAVQQSLENSGLLVFETIDDCINACNQLAPEHLEVHTQAPEAIKPYLKHYGALFLGNTSTVPFGDYLTGPNHTLPTSQTARFTGALNPMVFLRAQTWMQPGQNVQALAANTAHFADLEGLTAHAAAARQRLKPPAAL